MRVTTHPILPDEAPTDTVIYFDGAAIPAKVGEPVAAALIAAGVRVFRKTPRRDFPRGVYCGIGRCTDCVMIVDGRMNVRTCVTPVKPGMQVETQYGLGRKHGE